VDGPAKTSRGDAHLLLALTGRNQRTLNFAAALSIAGGLIVIAELATIALAIDSALKTASTRDTLTYIAIFAGLVLLRVFIDGISARMLAQAAEAVKLRARAQLTEAIAAISPLDRRRPHAGEIATLLTSHIETLGPYLTRYQPSKLRAAIVPLFVLGVTALFSWIAALVLLITGPLIPVFMALIGGKAREASERQLQEVGTMNGALLDRLQGLTTLKLFDAVQRATAALEQEGQTIRARTMAVLRIAFLSSAVLEMFAAIGVAFVAVYVGFTLLGQFSFGAYGELTSFAGLLVLMIAPEFFRPLRDFAAAYHDRAAALAASREIGKILDGGWLSLPARAEKVEALRCIEAIRAELSISGKSILPEFDLSVTRGEHIALVGPSGAGKSMLLALLGKIVSPSRGEILVNGTAASTCEVAWLGQKPAFIQGSLASNLSLYRRGSNQADLLAAVERAQATYVVAKLEHGFREVLRENASNVSGGEAQRLAIARLALSNADLILADEPTEHLDAETADAVIEGLFSFARGRTLIVATHDSRIMKRATRVIYVSKLGSHAGAAA